MRGGDGIAYTPSQIVYYTEISYSPKGGEIKLNMDKNNNYFKNLKAPLGVGV